MTRRIGLVVLLGAVLATTGCGTADKEAARQVVSAYLEACRRGDVDGAESLLSEQARERTWAAGVDVTFARSDTARFEVGGVELITSDVVHVASTWTDGDEVSSITWSLRWEAAGWRISGMQVPKGEQGEPTQWLDFENPDELGGRQPFAGEAP